MLYVATHSGSRCFLMVCISSQRTLFVMFATWCPSQCCIWCEHILNLSHFTAPCIPSCGRRFLLKVFWCVLCFGPLINWGGQYFWKENQFWCQHYNSTWVLIYCVTVNECSPTSLVPAPLVEVDKCRSKFMVRRQISNFVFFRFASASNLFVYQSVCFVDSYQSRPSPIPSSPRRTLNKNVSHRWAELRILPVKLKITHTLSQFHSIVLVVLWGFLGALHERSRALPKQ